ncbi:MAG: glycosyltransferase [Verrucomicrobiota bacterium]
MLTFSLIICCYNSIERIEQTLRAVCSMNTPDDVEWELIVVDNNSSDGTAEYCSQLLAELSPPSARVVEEKEPGLMNARICGAAAAKNDYLAFIDDDNWPDISWLEEAASIPKDYPEVGAWGGWCTGVGDEGLPEWFDKHAGKFACGKMPQPEGICASPFLRGAGLCIRKTAWDQICHLLKNPFLLGRTGKSLSSGDDNFICQLLVRHGWHLYYNPRMHMMHYMPPSRLTLDYLFRVHEGIGRSFSRLRPAVLVTTGWPKMAFHPLRYYYKLRQLPDYIKYSNEHKAQPDDIDLKCRYILARSKLFG